LITNEFYPNPDGPLVLLISRSLIESLVINH
jgi:hypothetical protein